MSNVAVLGATKAELWISGLGSSLDDLSEPNTTMGRHMVTSSTPKNFRAHGRPDPWKSATRWGLPTADPLVDEAKLLRSIDFVATKATLTIGTDLVKAPLLQFGTVNMPGGVLRPRTAKFLVQPVVGSNALTRSQARTMRPRDYPGAFPLMKGPQGPGIYRKASFTPVDMYAYARKNRSARVGGFKLPKRPTAQRTVELLWRFFKEAKIPPRFFLLFQDEDADTALEILMRYLVARGDLNAG